MATSIGEIAVKIGADTSGLKEGTKEAGKLLGELGEAGKALSSILTIVTGLSIAAAVAFTIHLAKSANEAIDAQSKLAYRLQGTVTGIQSVTAAADIAGLSTEGLNKSLGLMSERLAEAARKADGPAYDALKRLGLSAKDLLALDIDKRLIAIADRMTALGYSTQQQADVLRQFGIRGQEMIILFEHGGKRILEARDDIKAFGIAVSNIDAIKVEQSNEAWARANLIFKGIGTQLAVTIAPVLTDLAERFIEMGKEAGGFGPLIQTAVRTVIVNLGVLSTVIYNSRILFDDFAAGIEQFGNRVAGVFDKISLPSKVKQLNDKIGEVLIGSFSYIYSKLYGSSENAVKEITTVYGHLRDTLKPPDPEAWVRYWDEINAKAQKAAEEQEATRKKTNSSSATLDNLTEQDRKALEIKLANLKKSIATEDMALKEQRDKELLEVAEFERKKVLTASAANVLKLQIETKYQKDKKELIWTTLQESVAKEDEINIHAYEKRIRDLNIFEKNRTITTQQAADLRKKIEAKHALDILQITSRQYATLAGIVDTSLAQISQVIGQNGGAAFEIMKGISMATALVKGYEAVISAYAAGNAVGGPPVGVAFAAVAAAGVAAQIASLAAVKPSGTGATPTAPSGSAGDTSAATNQSGNSGGSQQTLFIQGLSRKSLYGGDAVRELVSHLIQYQRDGGKIVLAQ